MKKIIFILVATLVSIASFADESSPSFLCKKSKNDTLVDVVIFPSAGKLGPIYAVKWDINPEYVPGNFVTGPAVHESDPGVWKIYQNIFNKRDQSAVINVNNGVGKFRKNKDVEYTFSECHFITLAEAEKISANISGR